MTDNGRIKTTQESSFRKTVNILLPFLIYFVVHDLAQILLAFLVNFSMGAFGNGYGEFMTKNASTVSGLLNSLSLAIGMAAVWPMARMELKWAKVLGGTETDTGERTALKALKYVLLSIFAVSFALGVNLLMALAGFTRISERYQEVADRQYGVALGIGIYGAVLGIAITYSYEWFGSFFAPVWFHACANTAVFIAGYDKVVKGNIVTPLNCGIFMAVSAFCLLALWKAGSKK